MSDDCGCMCYSTLFQSCPAWSSGIMKIELYVLKTLCTIARVQNCQSTRGPRPTDNCLGPLVDWLMALVWSDLVVIDIDFTITAE